MSAGASVSTGRLAYLDNARYWAMLLVVVGHALTEFVVFPAARSVYLWIYLFHMPLFALISGYTGRNHVGDARHLRRMVSTLVVPYLIVELSLQLLTRHYDGNPEHLMLLSPQWVGWFLTALLIWRLTTPVWRALRYPVATAVVISLLVPLFEVPNVLALPKTLGFLPFYVLGMRLKPEHFERLTDVRVRIGAAVVLVAALVACRFIPEDFPSSWLLWKHRYDEDPLNAGILEGLATRAVLIVVGLVLTFAMLAVVSQARSWITSLGERTFYCYLLHGFFIIVIDREFNLFERLDDGSEWPVVPVVVAAIVLANLLMTKPVATLFRPLFEPRLNWMFRETPRDLRQRSRARRRELDPRNPYAQPPEHPPPT